MVRRLMFVVLILLSVFGLVWPAAEADSLPSFIRLHILANSDGEEDQALKLKVRDAVLEQTRDWFDHSKKLEDSRGILISRIPELRRNAERVLEEAGNPQQVRAYYGAWMFPDRCYGQLVLPAGEYEALRLVIGEGEGANWWCVVFPPLCMTAGEVDSQAWEKKWEKNSEASVQKIRIKPRSKILDMLQGL
ncbi:MAG: stage II sporulation protein R [Peptococcaceae bacterium]|nr:stage II sporulation protein R [Peptococcaceae bacterium]